jgi:hypothetical protein
MHERTFVVWMAEAAIRDRLPGQLNVSAVHIWRRQKRPLTPEQKVLYQRSCVHHGGQDSHTSLVKRRTYYDWREDGYRRENLFVCYGYQDELCAGSCKPPHRIYLR